MRIFSTVYGIVFNLIKHGLCVPEFRVLYRSCSERRQPLSPPRWTTCWSTIGAPNTSTHYRRLRGDGKACVGRLMRRIDRKRAKKRRKSAQPGEAPRYNHRESASAALSGDRFEQGGGHLWLHGDENDVGGGDRLVVVAGGAHAEFLAQAAEPIGLPSRHGQALPRVPRSDQAGEQRLAHRAAAEDRQVPLVGVHRFVSVRQEKGVKRPAVQAI